MSARFTGLVLGLVLALGPLRTTPFISPLFVEQNNKNDDNNNNSNNKNKNKNNNKQMRFHELHETSVT